MGTETNKIVFEAEVNGSTKVLNTFKDYKDALSALKKEQDNLTVGSDAWKKNQEQIELVNASIKELTKTEAQRNKEAEKAAKDQEKAIKEQGDALKNLKRELKDAQALALNGDGNAAKRVAQLKDQIEDLTDSTKALQGTGIEKGNRALNNLGEGFKNLDLDKIKLGFQGIGSALKAIPIFLIAEGVSFLIENWKELGEGNGIIAKSIQFLNKAFEEIMDTINAFTDLIGITNTKLVEQGEAIKTSADAQKEALAGVTAEYDRQLRVAKANGEDTVELEKAKQQAIIDTNVVIAKQIEAFVRAGGELDEEKRKLLTASLEAIKNAKVTEFEIEQTHNKKVTDDYKKRLDEQEKERLASADRISKGLQDEANRRFQIVKEEREELEKLEAQKLAEEQARAKLREDMRQQEIALERAANDELVKSWEKSEADKQAATNASFQHAQLVTQNLQAISDLAFAVRLNRVKKGSAEEESIMRKQFEINKKLQIAQTTISTITGAREAYKSLAGIPVVGPGLGIAAAALATLSGLAAIQKIQNTKFEGGGAPSIDSGGGGNISAGGEAPTTNTQAPSIQPFTRLDEDGNVTGRTPVVKAVVVETDITSSQKRVGRLENQATFG